MACVLRMVRCVISSFITKPQPHVSRWYEVYVALYLLSSPNHNLSRVSSLVRLVALYLLSSPNHNMFFVWWFCVQLRYIFFHHQTTTFLMQDNPLFSCVISSFITKPQLSSCRIAFPRVALYLLSSPNHNHRLHRLPNELLRYIFFHHQTTTRLRYDYIPMRCVISSFITKPQLPRYTGHKVKVALYLLSSPNHNCLRL